MLVLLSQVIDNFGIPVAAAEIKTKLDKIIPNIKKGFFIFQKTTNKLRLQLKEEQLTKSTI